MGTVTVDIVTEEDEEGLKPLQEYYNDFQEKNSRRLVSPVEDTGCDGKAF